MPRSSDVLGATKILLKRWPLDCCFGEDCCWELMMLENNKTEKLRDVLRLAK